MQLQQQYLLFIDNRNETATNTTAESTAERIEESNKYQHFKINRTTIRTTSTLIRIIINWINFNPNATTDF